MRLLRIYTAFFATSFAVQLQYRASGAVWMIGTILDPVIFLVVWRTVAASRGGEVAGFTGGELATYYIALMVVNHLTFTWIMHEFQWRIQEGQFSALLLRPVHPIHGDIADNLAYKAVMLVVLVPAVLLLVVLFRPAAPAASWALGAFVPCLAAAFALRFALGWTLALAAFWTTRTSAVNQLYFTCLILLSGRAAPLDALPGWLERVAKALPFYWVAGFPVEVFLGRLEVAAVVRGMGVQAAWATAMVAILALAWRGAVRRYSAVGG